MAWKKQLRTTLLLLLIIAGCLGTGFYFRSKNHQITMLTSDVEPVMQEVTDALKRYENHDANEVAALRTAAEDTVTPKAELVFMGLSNETVTRVLLGALQQNNIDASFFLTGEDATAYTKSISLIVNAGFSVGTAYTDAAENLDAIAAKRAISDFVRTSAAIQTAAGIWPSQILTLKKPGEELLAAAYACSMDTVIVPTEAVALKEVGTAELASGVLSKLPRASILCVKLSKTEPDAETAFGALCKAVAGTDLEARAENLVNTVTTEAEPLKRIYTTERAVAFTFSGLGNQTELEGALDALKTVNGVGTFFVTLEELTRYPDQVRMILDEGHSLGISVQASRFTSAVSLLVELYKTQEAIQTSFEYTDPLPVRPAFGSASGLLRKACGAGGFTLLSAMVNAVRTEDIRVTDASTVIDQILPATQGMLQRGEIVHFQMKQYQKSNRMLGDLVGLTATKRNIYSIKAVTAIANNPDDAYQYPLPDSAILEAVKDKIFPGQLSGSVMTAIATRYIGIDWVASPAFLPGFSTLEIKRLDKTGLVPNKDNEVFLTFDDWGTDQAITELLDVLRAHKAKATFFVRTQYVAYNPNLLRAIAVEGHTIGSHTNTHFPLSNDTGNGKKFTELTVTQVADLKKDLVTSYQVLQSIVGDIRVDGRPALSQLFRPPTLAVGKNGLEAVFDCGFSYSVSGYYTSQDYKATSAIKLAAALKKNTKSGAVLIMHMSDTSVYTAEALDIYLSEMERQESETKRYRFVGLSDALD